LKTIKNVENSAIKMPQDLKKPHVNGGKPLHDMSMGSPGA